MKIIVCVKQVPDTGVKAAVKPDGTLDRASMAAIANPDDCAAVEAALQIKDRLPEARIMLLSMGPAQAIPMLRELMAMGADEAVLVSAREFAGSDTFATSQSIAAAIAHLGLERDDIILCGRQAIDGDTAQVGPQIAEKLNLPQATYAVDITPEAGAVTVKRLLDNGYTMVRVPTPCLITCVREMNTPRHMSIYGILDSLEKPVTILGYEDLKDEPLIEADTIGLKGSPTNIAKSFTPPAKSAGERLPGAEDEASRALIRRLTERHIIR